MENIDLNLENYNLTDLLNLFKLDIYFKEDDLKTAKTMALKTHPDKSRLDQKFFVFFMRAYQRIEQIYNFRKKKEQDILIKVELYFSLPIDKYHKITWRLFFIRLVGY